MALELLQASTADALTITGIENYRKGYGVFLMQEIEALYPSAKEFTNDSRETLWACLINLTDLIYKELEGSSMPISKEMLVEYYNDLK